VNSDAFEISLSAIDEERFGFRTARADEVTLEALPEALDFCRANRIDWLIARCRVDQLRTAQAMEREGFSLMDTQVHYTLDLGKTPIPPDTGQALVRPVRPGEEDDVAAIAREAFRGYSGHYHADDRLDRAKCNEGYTSWAARSCVSRDVASEVLVAELEGSIVGFITMRMNSPQEAEVPLAAVVPAAQRHGVHPSLHTNLMERAVSKGVVRLVGAVHVINFSMQKNLVRFGYEPSHAFFTFHKWFD